MSLQVPVPTARVSAFKESYRHFSPIVFYFVGRARSDVSKFWAGPPVFTTVLTGQRYGTIVRLVNRLIPFGRSACPEILSARTIEILRVVGGWSARCQLPHMLGSSRRRLERRCRSQ